MGFHEDDRIRHKNNALNQAYEVYDSFLARSWSVADIAMMAEKELEKDPNNRVMYEVLKIAVRGDRIGTQIHHNQD